MFKQLIQMKGLYYFVLMVIFGLLCILTSCRSTHIHEHHHHPKAIKQAKSS